MSQIDRAGTFKGHITESSFSTTKNGFPQFVARFQADEMFVPGENGEPGAWADWSKYEEREMVGYFVLAGKDGNLGKNAEQLQKSLGWSGTSFEELDATDYSEIIVQFRVKNDTYNNQLTLKVCWIDHADADPSTSLRKMDKTEIKSLDAKFSKALKAFSGGAKPKVVPAGKPVTPKVTVDPTPSPSGTPTPTPSPIPAPSASTKAVKPKANKPTAPKADPTTTVPVGGPKPSDLDQESAPTTEQGGLPAVCFNADEAWAQVEANVDPSVPKGQVEETWLKAVEDLGGPDAIEKDGGWAGIRDIVLETLKQ
jgi:hypothetical protein